MMTVPASTTAPRWMALSSTAIPAKSRPMWLNSIMNAEMEFFNGVMHGDPIPDEFKAADDR